jgi:hypothetical protein
MPVKVTIRKKSAWQKRDCLFCSRNATQEARAESGDNFIAIRCCNKTECQKKAKEMAEKSLLFLPESTENTNI